MVGNIGGGSYDIGGGSYDTGGGSYDMRGHGQLTSGRRLCPC